MKKEILKQSEEIHKAQKDLEELSTHLAFDRKLDKGQEIQGKVTRKIHLPDSDNSEQKGQLLEVNDETALNYTIPVSDEIEQNDQLLEVDDETSLKYTVPTSNIFETLQNVSEDGIHIKTKEENHVLNRNPTKSKLDKKNLTIEFIMDSHGHGLVPQKIYRNKKLDVTVLPQGKKNFSGVIEHLEKSKTPKHFIIGVGCNDIDSRSITSATVKENVNQILNSPPKGSVMHFLPVFERMKMDDYNKRVAETNTTIKELCKQKSDSFFIEPKGKSTPFPSSSEPNMYARDGIHFNNLGKRSLVRKIKAHLNPHLGLKDYNHYEAPLERPKQIRSENNRQSWTSSGWGHIRPKFERPRQQQGKNRVRRLLEELLDIV